MILSRVGAYSRGVFEGWPYSRYYETLTQIDNILITKLLVEQTKKANTNKQTNK